MRSGVALRASLTPALLLGLVACRAPPTVARTPPGWDVAEATIPELQREMESGRLTAVELVEAYLARIDAYDQDGPRLNALVRLNPDARAEAEALDRERRERGPRGPLHGIPVIVKDNYDVAGLPTTAGSLAMAGLVPRAEAFQVRKLREAGAVILGKANMHELASGITGIGSLGGQTRNPYDLSRNPGGSSSGTGAAVAASFAAVGWGSDTCGSIRIPASHGNLFGLRPTKGLSSIAGILPLSHTQDVGGPLARTAIDLAIALDGTVGPDPDDPATAILEGRELPRFVDALDDAALAGARVGVLGAYFGSDPEDAVAGGVVRAALDRMAEAGAVLVPVEIPGLGDLMQGAGVIDHEFKWDLASYLAAVPGSPVDSLGDILARGLIHDALVATTTRRNGAEAPDSESYLAALARRGPLREAVLEVLDGERLDALAYPTMRRPPAPIGEPQPGSNCGLSANTGLPALSVPSGFTPEGLPIGLELLGRPLDDARLLALGYAFEQAARPRWPPASTPPLTAGCVPEPVRFRVVATAAGLDPPVESDAHVDACFALDRATGTLHYQVDVSGVPAGDVHAVVVRRRAEAESDGPPWRVVEVISGPGRLDAAGAWALGPDDRSALEDGELHLEVFTRTHPAGAARARITLPGSG